MERHAFSINYNVSKEKKRKDGSIPINATINLNGIRASFSTGRKVLIEDWDTIKQHAKGNSELVKLIKCPNLNLLCADRKCNHHFIVRNINNQSSGINNLKFGNLFSSLDC